MNRTILLAGIGLLVAVTPGLASSEDAWAEFRANVEKGCRRAVADRLDDATFSVDPFGSDSYGVAIARGMSRDAKAPRAIVCIFHKRTKAVEASGEFKP